MLLLAFLVLVSISCIGDASEIFVQPGTSIQNAINNAASGDVIIVKPGTYTENIKIIKDNITIESESENPDDTIIKAKSPSSHVFFLQADNVKINGLKINGAIRYGYTGICLSSCSNCIIENNKLSDNSFGVYLLNSKENKISKNFVSSNTRGVYFNISEGNILSGNKVTTNREYGIILVNSINNILLKNTVYNNERGVYLSNSDSNTISSNTIQYNNIFGLFTCGKCDKDLVYNNYFNDTNMTIKSGIGNAYNTTKKAGPNIVGGPYIGGNYWAKPDGTGFSQTAVDKNGDGISDSAYTRITDSIYSDHMPLVIPKVPVSPLPVADFRGYPKSGYPPLDVTFTDTSTDKPTAWKWNFGDGTYSTQQNPVHTYSEAGIYGVTLTVSNEAGIDTLKKANYINVTAFQKPVADFEVSPKSGDAPLDVTFTDTSTEKPTAWKWNFGDGTYSTQQNSVHTYSEAGNYTVTLTAGNKVGLSTITKANCINVTVAQKPVANFWGSPRSGNESLNVAFTDISTGSPRAWKWNFGDGTYSTQHNPVHTYSEAGIYSVTLTVSNAAGSGTLTKNNYITIIAPQKPVAAFSASPTSGNVPLNVTFTDTSTEKPIAWYWSFGDGKYSTVKNPSHTYSVPGNYTVTLTASNTAGKSTQTKINYINVTQKPVANFWGTPTLGNAPVNISFTDTSTGTPTAWKWDFGDGTYSTEQNSVHTYSAPGNYTVTLTASNMFGFSTITRVNYINAIVAERPVANFWGSPRSGNESLSVAFTDISTGLPTAWKWNFGDGTFSTAKSPTHTYSAAGIYAVTLTVSNAAGTGTLTKNNYITVIASQKPVAAFSASPTSGNAPLDVTFTDMSTEKPISWSWNFGDGTYSTVKNPSHTYSEAGNYTVTLTASNTAGTNIITRMNYITVKPALQKPVANFWGSPKSGEAPFNVTFTDISTGTPTAWNWSFGDGTYSTQQNPVHTYSATGNYAVTLTVSNAVGAGTMTKPNYINVTQRPIADFWGAPKSGEVPLDVAFNDISTGQPTAWKWSFGDGTYSTQQNPVHTYSAAGNYTVTFTASSTVGTSTITKDNYITALQKPVANFWGTPKSGEVPLDVTFTDTSTGGPTHLSWNFGDGIYSTQQNPKHTYTEAGNYTVTLSVSNAAGVDTMTKANYIAALQKPIANFSGTPVSGNAPLNVTFTDTSTRAPTAWNWNFGDGTYSTQQNPVHTYSSAGNYTVMLTASNTAGTNTITRMNYIIVEPALQKPVANFWGSPKSGNASFNVIFNDISTGEPTAWKWNFGDGTNSTQQNPVHTYSAAGIYSVTLTVSNAAGTGTMTKHNYINVAASQKPVADFWGSPKSGNLPLNVVFTDTSKGAPTAWSWNFGDGTSSTAKSPTHSYSAAGNYTVKLTVSNTAGTGTMTKTNYIKAGQP